MTLVSKPWEVLASRVLFRNVVLRVRPDSDLRAAITRRIDAISHRRCLQHVKSLSSCGTTSPAVHEYETLAAQQSGSQIQRPPASEEEDAAGVTQEDRRSRMLIFEPRRERNRQSDYPGLANLVEKLSGLQDFTWDTYDGMPEAVFNAIERHSNPSLRLHMPKLRFRHLHTMKLPTQSLAFRIASSSRLYSIGVRHLAYGDDHNDANRAVVLQMVSDLAPSLKEVNMTSCVGYAFKPASQISVTTSWKGFPQSGTNGPKIRKFSLNGLPCAKRELKDWLQHCDFSELRCLEINVPHHSMLPDLYSLDTRLNNLQEITLQVINMDDQSIVQFVRSLPSLKRAFIQEYIPHDDRVVIHEVQL